MPAVFIAVRTFSISQVLWLKEPAAQLELDFSALAAESTAAHPRRLLRFDVGCLGRGPEPHARATEARHAELREGFSPAAGIGLLAVQGDEGRRGARDREAGRVRQRAHHDIEVLERGSGGRIL